MSSDDSENDSVDIPSEFLQHRDPNAPMVQVVTEQSEQYIQKIEAKKESTQAQDPSFIGNFDGGDGLDGFLPQGDDGKYDDVDDIFAGTDMAMTAIPSTTDPGFEENISDFSGLSQLDQWNAERKQYLMDKRSNARQGKETLVEKAKTDIEKFYIERKERITQIKAENKKEEERYIQEVEDLMNYGAPWEKVARLVDLKPKQRDLTSNTNIARMRTLLIQLKNEKKS